MEEEKAAAYYEELTRKGGGAARFKQGLGFSSSSENDAVPAKQYSSSSFLSNFVKASSPTSTSNLEKQAQLESIQNKLKKKPTEEQPSQSRAKKDKDKDKDCKDRERDYRDRDRDRESDRYRERDSRDRDRESDRYRERDSRDRDRESDRYRERDSRDRDRRDRNRERDRERERDGDRDYRDRDRETTRRRKRRSASPPERREEKRREVEREKKGKVDYSRLIEGYDKMTPAERVKAKTKLQLAETAEKDEMKGSGWERFEFNKDAPLDDEEIEVAEDDAAIVKRIGQSFRFSTIEARREEQIKAAHDEAMFGASGVPPSVSSDGEPEADISEKKNDDTDLATSLFSEKVLAKQQGSWRDRARKV